MLEEGSPKETLLSEELREMEKSSLFSRRTSSVIVIGTHEDGIEGCSVSSTDVEVKSTPTVDEQMHSCL